MGLTISRRLRVFFSSLLLQASWSFAGLQSLGFIHTLVAGSSRSRIRQHTDCFNTHPYMVGFIVGAILGIEDRGKELLREHMKRLKAALESAFASVGDLFFWNLLRPALALIAVILTIKFGLIGPIFFILSYNLIHLYTRFYGIRIGYERGSAVIEVLKSPLLWKTVSLLELIGIFATGLLFGIFLPVQNPDHVLILILLSIFSIFWIIRQKPLSVLFLILVIFVVIKGIL